MNYTPTIRFDGEPFHRKGRACKGCTMVGDRWFLIYHTGLLEYGSRYNQ